MSCTCDRCDVHTRSVLICASILLSLIASMKELVKTALCIDDDVNAAVAAEPKSSTFLKRLGVPTLAHNMILLLRVRKYKLAYTWLIEGIKVGKANPFKQKLSLRSIKKRERGDRFTPSYQPNKESVATSA